MIGKRSGYAFGEFIPIAVNPEPEITDRLNDRYSEASEIRRLLCTAGFQDFY